MKQKQFISKPQSAHENHAYRPDGGQKKETAQLEIELKTVLEQEKQTADAVVDDKGRPLPPNCVILRSKKLGGIKYEYLKPELIPLESYNAKRNG